LYLRKHNTVVNYGLYLAQEIEMNRSTIGNAAHMAGVGVETIRFYERKGLIAQPQKPHGGGYRIYSDEIIRRIRFIRQGQDLGFSLKEIGELLTLRANPNTDCSEVQKRANEKLAEVEMKILRLKDIKTALKDVISACPARGSLKSCSIISALENRSV
jgi:MerR family transcriptional regulator, copper efflux regulator